MNLLDKALGIHPQALQLRSQRLELLAQNIANADTPHFKARDIDFKAVLNAASQPDTALSTSHPGHQRASVDLALEGPAYRVPLSNAVDGNTVEMSIEQAQYGKAAAEYQATLNFLENRFSGLRKALRGE